MDVQVGHGLAAGLPLIDADVVTVRAVALVQQDLGAVQRCQEGDPFFLAGLEQGGEMPAGNDDGMARGDRKTILVDHGELILGQDAGRVQDAKRAGFHEWGARRKIGRIFACPYAVRRPCYASPLI